MSSQARCRRRFARRNQPPTRAYPTGLSSQQRSHSARNPGSLGCWARSGRSRAGKTACDLVRSRTGVGCLRQCLQTQPPHGAGGLRHRERRSMAMMPGANAIDGGGDVYPNPSGPFPNHWDGPCHLGHAGPVIGSRPLYRVIRRRHLEGLRPCREKCCCYVLLQATSFSFWSSSAGHCLATSRAPAARGGQTSLVTLPSSAL